jgi:hypothetical protein
VRWTISRGVTPMRNVSHIFAGAASSESAVQRRVCSPGKQPDFESHRVADGIASRMDSRCTLIVGQPWIYGHRPSKRPGLWLCSPGDRESPGAPPQSIQGRVPSAIAGLVFAPLSLSATLTVEADDGRCTYLR